MFYTSTQTLPQGNGNHFIGGLASKSLNRMILNGRDTKQGQDGSL